MSLFGKKKPKTQQVQLAPEGEAYIQHVREEMKGVGHPVAVSLSPGMVKPVEKPRKRFGLF